MSKDGEAACEVTPELDRAHAAFAKIGACTLQRQIFLCAISEKQKCCSREEGQRAWAFLKMRLKQLGLVGPRKNNGPDGDGNGCSPHCGGVQRAKADCLQICAAGPIAVIWPDNIWYHSCNEEVLELIIQRHLIGGKVVEQYQLTNPPTF